MIFFPNLINHLFLIALFRPEDEASSREAAMRARAPRGESAGGVSAGAR